MLGLFAGLRDSSLYAFNLSFGEELLVVLELSFEAEVWTDLGPTFSDEGDGLSEA